MLVYQQGKRSHLLSERIPNNRFVYVITTDVFTQLNYSTL